MSAVRPLTRQLQAALLPVRRALSRVVLVYEERHFRDVAIGGVYAALSAHSDKLAEGMRGLEERVILRVDVLMEELWRRTESVGARQATQLQRLASRVDDAQRSAQHESQTRAPEMARLAQQMAEVYQLASEVSEIRRLATASAHASGGAAGGGGPLLTELQRGVRLAPRERWEPLVKHFLGLAPVVALGCTTTDFLALAFEAEVDAYAVEDDQAAVQRASKGGFDARLMGALDHLRSLPEDSIGGTFTSLVTHPVGPAELEQMIAEIARTLHPEGVALIEAPNPASLACTWEAAAAQDGPRLLLSPDALAAPALRAGLEVEGCRYAPQATRHLGGVTGELADAGLREIADGVNELVAQLNDLLYGPQDYALILRKP